MKRAILFAGLVLFFTLAVSTTAFGGLVEVDRTWVSGDYGYVLISYCNNTSKTFKHAVTIQCIALDASGNKIGMNQRSFFCHEYGPIEPGFKGAVEIPIQLHGSKMDSVQCKCREW